MLLHSSVLVSGTAGLLIASLASLSSSPQLLELGGSVPAAGGRV